MKEQIEALKNFLAEKIEDLEAIGRAIRTDIDEYHSTRSEDLDDRFVAVHTSLNKQRNDQRMLSNYVMGEPQEKEKDEGK